MIFELDHDATATGKEHVVDAQTNDAAVNANSPINNAVDDNTNNTPDAVPSAAEAVVDSVPHVKSTNNNVRQTIDALENSTDSVQEVEHNLAEQPAKRQRTAVVLNTKPIVIDDNDTSNDVIDTDEYLHNGTDNTVVTDDSLPSLEYATQHPVQHATNNSNNTNNDTNADIVDLTDDADDDIQVLPNNKHKTNFQKYADTVQQQHNNDDDIILPIAQQPKSNNYTHAPTAHFNNAHFNAQQHQALTGLLQQMQNTAAAEIDLTDDNTANSYLNNVDPTVFNRTDADDARIAAENQLERYGTVTSMILPDVNMFNNAQQPVQPRIGDELVLVLYQNELTPYTLRAFQKHIDNNRVLLGALPQNDAHVLGPYILRHQLRLKCIISSIDFRVLGVRIEVYGIKRDRFNIEKDLVNSVIRYASYGSGQYSTTQYNGQSETELTKHIEKLFTHKLDLDVLPELPTALSTIMSTQLHSFQADGVRWMLYREGIGLTNKTDKSTAALKQRQAQSEQVKLARGGILADEMGLGKTLQFIALLTADLLYMNAFNDNGCITEHKPTLIICPLSVIENWQTQITRHITDSTNIKVYVYHGTNRVDNVTQLMKYDIVITTYATCASDYIAPEEGDTVEQEHKGSDSDDSVLDSQQTSPLYNIQWHRIILDEGHIIRERKTRQSRACSALVGARRWIASGTPFQNKIDDIYALLRFIQVDQLQQLKIFTKIILQPIKTRNPVGQQRLHQLLQNICLRRLKTTQIDDKQGRKRDLLILPPKTVRLRIVELDAAEKKLYDLLASTGKKEFNKLVKQGGRAEVMKHYAHILEMLLRLRQCCDHASLVPTKYHSNGFAIAINDDAAQHKQELIDILEDSINETCMLCHTIVTDPVITDCAHIVCQQCIVNAIQKHQQSHLEPYQCVVCGRIIKLEQLITLQDVQLSKQADELELIASTQKQRRSKRKQEQIPISSKLDVLIDELKQARQRDSTAKAVVFSQWTSFLDLCEIVLSNEAIQFVRLDGTMTAGARSRAMQQFSDNNEIQVFLISLKAGGVGLNLTAANQVFMMDIWWNPYSEDQAIDRVHRMGQTKPVDIIRLIAKDTVEQKVVDMQQTKRDMTKDVLTQSRTSKQSRQEEQGLRMQDLSNLFNITDHSSNGHSSMNGHISSNGHTSSSNMPNCRNTAYHDEIL